MGKTWTFDQVTVKTWYHHRDFACGKDVLGYRLVDKGKVIFEGEDFRPSPMFAQDSDNVVMALLSFLTLQLGDTDDEYFAEYTQEQLEWIAGESAEELRYVWTEFEYAKENEK